MIEIERATRREWLKFLGNVQFTDKCWLWTGSLNDRGYGRFYFRGKRVRAHRFAYIQLKGEIEQGLEPDHTCKYRHCVNPDCIEITSHRLNLISGTSFVAKNGAKTHCPSGHEYNAENTSYSIQSDGSSLRRCKACNRAKVKKYIESGYYREK